MKCHNCEKNAIFLVGPKGQQAPLCLDCCIRYQNLILRRQEMLERETNYLADEIESVAGFPGILPRFPERHSIINTGGFTLNNIHVSNSEIGVLNTGTIESVDASVTVLKSEGNTELAIAVAALSEAVIKSNDIANNQKNQILELLSALSEEAVAPREKRKIAVAKAVLADLSAILGGIATLGALREKTRVIFQQMFGM